MQKSVHKMHFNTFFMHLRHIMHFMDMFLCMLLSIAPVDTPNKRLPDAVKKQLQKKLLIYLIVLSLLFVLCYCKKNSLYCTVINLSLALTAASQLTGILINRHTKGSDVNDTKCCNM